MKTYIDTQPLNSSSARVLSLLNVCLRSYQHSPVRFVLTILSICASCLTFTIGWHLADALERIKPDIPADHYLILNAAAASEAQSFIPVSSMNDLRSLASGSSRLRDVTWRTSLVLNADVIIDDSLRHPSFLRGMVADQDGKFPGLSMVSGRQPRAGQRELLISPALKSWLLLHGGAERVQLARRSWTVVGVANRAGAESQAEMVSDLISVQQEMDVTDALSSIETRLDTQQSAELKQIFSQIKDYRLQAIPLSTYQGRFVDQLYKQLEVFWLAFMGVSIVCTIFSIYTIALTLLPERERIRRIVLQLGFSPRMIATAELLEGAVIGAVAAGVSLLIFIVLFQDEQMQSIMPSGTVKLTMEMSIPGALACALLGAALGAGMFSWRKKKIVKN